MLLFTENAEWVKVPILETIQRVICRTTNRIFVGAPLCLSLFPVLQSFQWPVLIIFIRQEL